MSLETNNRAIAYNIFIFIGTILLGALLIMIFDDPQVMLIEHHANMTTNAAADTGRGYVVDYWNALPWFIMVVGTVQLVAAAAYKSERGRF